MSKRSKQRKEKRMQEKQGTGTVAPTFYYSVKSNRGCWITENGIIEATPEEILAEVGDVFDQCRMDA